MANVSLDDFMNSSSMDDPSSTPSLPPTPLIATQPAPPSGAPASVSMSDFSGGDMTTIKPVMNPQDIPKPAPQMQEVQPATIPTGLFSSNGKFVGGLAAPVMDALSSSEQAAGNDIGGFLSELAPGVKTAQSKAQAAQNQSMAVFNQLVQTRHTQFLAGKDTTQLDASIASAAKALGISNIQNILPQAATKTSGQIAGDFGGVALDIITSGTLLKGANDFKLLSAAEKTALAEKGITSAADAEKALTTAQKYYGIAKDTAKTAAIGAGLGYGYDVANNAQQGKTGAEAFKPGMGTVIGASVPSLFGLYEAGKLTAKQLAPAIDNWTMRALPKQFRYGANPGKTVSEMGITGNSLEDWGQNVKKAIATVGKKVGSLADKVATETGNKTLDLTDELKPLDDAIQKAAKNNDSAAMSRLQDAKQAISQEMRAGNYTDKPVTNENGVPLPGKTQKVFTEGATDENGKMVAGSVGARDLTKASFSTALEVKRQVGELTKWTGNQSDDKTVNMALKRVYGGISDKLEDAAGDTTVGESFAKANKDYNNLKTADIAITRANSLASSHSMFSFPEKVAGAAGIATALATRGVAAVPEILAGVGGDLLLKALNSVAVRTRVASWLGSEAPSVIEKFYAEHPDVAKAVYTTFSKPNNSIDEAVRQKIVEMADERGSFSLEDVPKKAEEGAPKNAVTPFTNTGDLSTKILSQLEGKTTVSRQYIEDLTNQGSVKQVEKDLIRSKLAEVKGDTINVPEFAKSVQSDLLPLERNGTVGNAKTGEGGQVGKSMARYESIALPNEDRGNVKNYSENVYRSPIKTSAGNTHFSNRPDSDNYFGHTRVEDMADNKTRRVIEVQSDLYQKGNLENSLPEEKIGKVGDMTIRGPNPKDLEKLSQYNDPTAHFRMVREEVKQAAKDGKSVLQFPTGETAMKIEGLGQGTDLRAWQTIEPSKGAFPYHQTGTLTAENLNKVKPGDLVAHHGDPYVITENLGDGKFYAVRKDSLDENILNSLGVGRKKSVFVNGKEMFYSEYSREEFDISGKVDQNNPIYKFYEKDLGKYLKSKYGATQVTDKQGVNWWNVNVDKSMSKGPVEAFAAAGGLVGAAQIKKNIENKQKDKQKQ